MVLTLGASLNHECGSDENLYKQDRIERKISIESRLVKAKVEIEVATSRYHLHLQSRVSRVKNAASWKRHPSIPERRNPNYPHHSSTPLPPTRPIPTHSHHGCPRHQDRVAEHLYQIEVEAREQGASCKKTDTQSMPNTSLDMLRLRRKEPNMEFRTIWHLPVPRLLVQPS